MNSGFTVPQESVEAGLLYAVNQDMEHWLQLSIFTQEDFSVHRDIYLFFKQHLAQYASLPHNSQIATRFNWNPPVGEFRYWYGEMQRYSLARKVLDSIKEAYQKISGPDKALGVLLDQLSIIRSTNTNHIQATDSSAGERYSKYEDRIKYIFGANKIIGLRTGIKVIDDTLIGWTPGSMVGVYARPGVGKTWWLLWEAAMAWMDGNTILVIAPEMPANLLNLRSDVVIGQMLGLPLDYGKLLVGNPDQKDNYLQVTNILSQSKRWWTYDSLNDRPIGLGEVASLIRQHEPALICIDGISLLRSDYRGQMWEQMKDLSYGLKNLATIHERPIIVTHQTANSARGRRSEAGLPGRGDDFIMPSLNDAAFGDAFAQACSDVITMCGEPTSANINWYSIRKHRERGWRQPLSPRMGMAIDFGTGRLHDLGHLGFDPEQVGAEARRILGI